MTNYENLFTFMELRKSVHILDCFVYLCAGINLVLYLFNLEEIYTGNLSAYNIRVIQILNR
jgi:hypothetical protein